MKLHHTGETARHTPAELIFIWLWCGRWYFAAVWRLYREITDNEKRLQSIANSVTYINANERNLPMKELITDAIAVLSLFGALYGLLFLGYGAGL